MTRRTWLVACTLVVVASAAHPVGAQGTVKAEAQAYGGTGSGHWACGPSAQVRYGGLGGKAAVRLWAPALEPGEDPAPARGVHVTGKLAGEYRSYQVIDCKGTSPCAVPPNGLVAGGSMQLGYDWTWVGLRGGVLAYQRHLSASDSGATTRAWPDLALRVGKTSGVWGELGVGAYNVPTTLRPGAYLGLGLTPEPGWAMGVHAGVHQNFDGEAIGRLDLSGRVPLGAAVGLLAGAAVSTGEQKRLHPELRLGLSADL